MLAPLPSAFIVSVGKLPYYIPGVASFIGGERWNLVGKLPLSGPSPTPATVFVLDSYDDFQASALSEMVDLWLESDDVFSSEFLSNVCLVLGKQPDTITLQSDFLELLGKWHTETVQAFPNSPNIDLPSGPYFLTETGFHQAWRLFEDVNGAFMFPVVPDSNEPRKFLIPGTTAVPVPSRCYFSEPSPSKPLSGKRIAIKDNIDLNGVPTSTGNQAFQALYGRRERNAQCVERLLNAGAIVIGKLKMVQFASGENAKDWFDYQAPFSPRGDGYQDPGCSSAGSATAISSYDWVDISLGTDTFGSVIGPAADHGLFGLRPTLHSISTEGIVPVSKELDTIGTFTRNLPLAISTLKSLASTELKPRTCSPILKLIYPTDIFAGWPDEYHKFSESIISQLESFLKVKRTHVDIGLEFQKDTGYFMRDYLDTTTAHIQLRDCYRNCVPFVEEYRRTLKKEPFVDPYIAYKWSIGKDLSDKQYQDALSQRDLFSQWVQNRLLPSPAGSDVDTIVIMPSGDTEPFYRHVYDGRTLEEGARRKQGFGFKDQALAVLPGLPFLTIPVGQFPYSSTITNRQEYIPGAIAFIGPSGSDLPLLELVAEFLVKTPGLQESVNTGRTAFDMDMAPQALL